MDKLSMEDAMALAGSLVTIGHPFTQVAINATAYDLTAWCPGTIRVVAGRRVEVITPKRQAEQLIAAARAWKDGWPERGGTKKLHALCCELFGETKPEWVPLSYEETLSRGLIKPPCERCDDSGYIGRPPNVEFCACALGRHQKQWEGELGLRRINRPPERPTAARAGTLQPFTPITEAQMKKALEDEQRRKAEQLRREGLD